MKRFVGGVVIGLVLSAGVSSADFLSYQALQGVRIELQRIANALDRLVSMEAQKLPAERRPQ